MRHFLRAESCHEIPAGRGSPCGILRGYAPLGIAFSGGADSTALAVFASRVLNTGDVILIHAETPLAPGRESQLVRETAKRYSIPLKTVFIDVLSDPAIRANDSMRCYHCKNGLWAVFSMNCVPQGSGISATAPIRMIFRLAPRNESLGGAGRQTPFH